HASRIPHPASRLDGTRGASRRCLRFRAPRRRPTVRPRGEPPAVRGAARLAAGLGNAVPGAHARGRGARARADVHRSGARSRPLARRGPPRPMVTLSEHAGARRAAIAAGGLYRWAFRGGASGEAYRALVAGLVDWLLEQGAGSGKRFVPVTYETPNGMPLQWRWTG